ncbi:uncharacterized protein V6R79_010623 [Siganus canaliculatus]
MSSAAEAPDGHSQLLLLLLLNNQDSDSQSTVIDQVLSNVQAKNKQEFTLI